MLGRLFCWMGLHDWYKGIHRLYCARPDCDAEVKDFHNHEDVECDDT